MLPGRINHANAVNVRHMQIHPIDDMLPRSSPFTYTQLIAILTGGVFLACRFALFEATFGVGLHCRVDALVLPFAPPPLAFCAYITKHHTEFSVGRKILYGRAEGKGPTF